MLRALKAGFAYFAAVFAAGFVLGSLRVLVIAPQLGEAIAVVLELPVILAIAWIACRRIVDRFDVPASPGSRFAMGTAAFVLLMGAELALAVFGFGRTVSEHLASYWSAPMATGLLGQVLYALFPLIQLRRPTHS